MSTSQTKESGTVPPYLREALSGLTRVQRRFIVDGSFHGDVALATVRALRARAIFYFHPTSPNGRCGEMRLTPLGERVQTILKDRAALAKVRGQ